MFAPNLVNASEAFSIVTSAADASTATIITSGVYLIVISGGGAGTSLNLGAAATVAMPTFIPGTYGPWYIGAAGADGKLHAIALAAGRVDLLAVTILQGY